MKKNRMMRVASALLIAVLLTTCSISGTFAKYVTTASASDTARVAKWGVGVSVSVDPFANSYAKTDGNAISANTVVSATEGTAPNTTQDDVVAPGTSGTFGTIQITGAPEVEVIAETVVDVELSDGWKYNSGANNEVDSMYFPLVITVANTVVDLSGCDTLEKVEVAIEDAIIKAVLNDSVQITADDIVTTGRSAIQHYGPNSSDLADASAITISWSWPFSSTNDVNDVKDTYLGNHNEDATISVSISVTVTQVD